MGYPARATKPLTLDQQRLAEDFYPDARRLALAFAARAGMGGLEDEYIAGATDGLLKAAQQWEPKRGDFRPYASRMVHYGILNVIGKYRRNSTGHRRKGKGRFTTVAFAAEHVPAYEEQAPQLDSEDAAEQILSNLPEGLPRQIMRLFVVDGLKASEVAVKVGIGDLNTTTNVIKWCFARLRESLQAV